MLIRLCACEPCRRAWAWPSMMGRAGCLYWCVQIGVGGGGESRLRVVWRGGGVSGCFCYWYTPTPLNPDL